MCKHFPRVWDVTETQAGDWNLPIWQETFSSTLYTPSEAEGSSFIRKHFAHFPAQPRGPQKLPLPTAQVRVPLPHFPLLERGGLYGGEGEVFAAPEAGLGSEQSAS